MNYGLPTTVNIDGKDLHVRTDFRAILDVQEAMNDPELSEQERVGAAMYIFYLTPEEITDFEAAVKAMFWFIGGGKESDGKKSPRVMDWEQDFPNIIAPVNRVLGYEARSVPYNEETGEGLHWWTFLSAYMEIGGDCLMSQIMQIREKKARGKQLTKEEKSWYRRNRALVDIKTHYSEAEDDLVKEWTQGVTNNA